MSAAREIFVEEGYTKTSMVMIGERATVGYNTIYCYFNGKNKVMAGVVDQLLIDLYELLEEPAVLESAEALRQMHCKIAFLLFAFAREHQQLLNVYKDATSCDDFVASHFSSVFDKITECVVSAIDSVGQKSIAKDLEPRICAKAFSMMLMSYFWEFVNGREEEEEKVAECIAEIFMHGLYR